MLSFRWFHILENDLSTEQVVNLLVVFGLNNVAKI